MEIVSDNKFGVWGLLVIGVVNVLRWMMFALKRYEKFLFLYMKKG